MLICAALIAVTAAVYVQTFDFDFTNFDDRVYVIDNEHVSSGLTLENVLWAFTARRANNWHPLTWISHMVDVELSGLDPGAHHVTNVVLHVFNTLLVFVVLNRMTRRKLPSAYVAALVRAFSRRRQAETEGPRFQKQSRRGACQARTIRRSHTALACGAQGTPGRCGFQGSSRHGCGTNTTGKVTLADDGALACPI